MTPERAGDVDGDQHVVDIVEPVEGADFAEAVGDQPLDPQLDDVVGHHIEADEVLGAGERAERRVGDALAHQPHALPGVLLEIANADVELDRAGEIDALEADAVHALGDRQHVRGRHAGRPQALVGITQRGVDDGYVSHASLHNAVCGPRRADARAHRSYFFLRDASALSRNE